MPDTSPAILPGFFREPLTTERLRGYLAHSATLVSGYYAVDQEAEDRVAAMFDAWLEKQVEQRMTRFATLAGQWEDSAVDHYAQSERGADAMVITAQGCIAGTYATAARALRALLHVDIESEAGA